MRGRNFYSSFKLLHNHVPLSDFGRRELGGLEIEVSVDRGVFSRGLGQERMNGRGSFVRAQPVGLSDRSRTVECRGLSL